jgi:hypothetical protein
VTADRTVRQARPRNHDAVAAFTRDTRSDRDFEDYVPGVFPEWVDGSPDGYTVVTEVEDEVAGLASPSRRRPATSRMWRSRGRRRATTRCTCSWRIP